MNKNFLIGSATAAHQVEGNNIHSDFWAQEHMKSTSFDEPSLDAVNHYNMFREDIDLMKLNGLNAYRFSIEWARIEPQKGKYDFSEIEHYREVIEYCNIHGIEPIPTLHHFSSPKWIITEGGWENRNIIDYFAKYASLIAHELGDSLKYICTINEANMGLQIAAVSKAYMQNMKADVQVGINEIMKKQRDKQKEENIEVFGTEVAQTFLSLRSNEGDQLIIDAHIAARKAIKSVNSNIQVGLSLSVYDIQVHPGGEKHADEAWESDFGHYVPYIKDDDFLGVQNYTRKEFDATGKMPLAEGVRKTQMNYEFYPQSIGNVLKRIAKEISIPLMVTENGIATSDDDERIEHIEIALKSVYECIEEGLPILGYMYWSFLDNFEWQRGFKMKFGLVEVDRSSQKRTPKKSLKFLGQYNNQLQNKL